VSLNLNNSKVDFIELRFKLLFMAKVSLLIALASIASGFFLYLYYSKKLGNAYTEAFLTIIEVNKILWFVIFMTLLVSFLILSASTLILALLVSHKIAGPIYGLERILREIGEKKFSHQEFCLRRNDQIKALACLFVQIGFFFGEKIKSIKKSVIHAGSNFENIDRLIRQKDFNPNEVVGSLNRLIDETEDVLNIIDSDIILKK
jgi:hypothetical protein